MAHGHDSFMALQDVPEDESGSPVQDFEAFTRAQHADLLKYFRAHLPSDTDAQDAAQESLLRLLQYRGKPAGEWRPLLFGIATNLVAEFYRRSEARHTGKHVALDEERLQSEAAGPDEEIERNQRKALLRAAILELSPRSRQIYLLSRVDGLTYPQIAQRCGISPKAVETSIARTVGELALRVGGRDRRAL